MALQVMGSTWGNEEKLMPDKAMQGTWESWSKSARNVQILNALLRPHTHTQTIHIKNIQYISAPDTNLSTDFFIGLSGTIKMT